MRLSQTQVITKGIFMLRIIWSLFFLSFFLLAQQPIQGILLTKAVFEERVVWDNIKGNLRTMVLATKAQQNATLVYVNQLTNHSSVNKTNVVIDNPIPYGTTYIPNSASCEGACQLYYSIDGGRSFKKQEELFVVYGTKKRTPLGDEYTHIKFVFPQLIPYQKVRMAFKSQIK
jgi:uncharacterized repeat protein (TIGR01451 family)